MVWEDRQVKLEFVVLKSLSDRALEIPRHVPLFLFFKTLDQTGIKPKISRVKA